MLLPDKAMTAKNCLMISRSTANKNSIVLMHTYAEPTLHKNFNIFIYKNIKNIQSFFWVILLRN